MAESTGQSGRGAGLKLRIGESAFPARLERGLTQPKHATLRSRIAHDEVALRSRNAETSHIEHEHAGIAIVEDYSHHAGVHPAIDRS